MYFDTHAHYNNNRFDDDRDELLSSMQADGITRILNVSYNLPSVRQALCMADKYPFAYATAGIHPHDTKTMADDTVLELESYLSHPKAVAVGEIGLDYHYDFSPRDVQRARFREQMELARRLKLPVVIHMRDATQDTLKIAHDFKDVICVYHCFPETYEIAKIVFDMGGYISFTGIVTFKNAQQARDVVKKMPLDRLMLETDCPYMSPEPFRGRRCTSLYLP
ncbi:MAG: TatD family hydrolase, partial [Oscillospiraceae bacterium]|nr:TatD family hydrolase [Oscillospiraceae bacterium]